MSKQLSPRPFLAKLSAIAKMDIHGPTGYDGEIDSSLIDVSKQVRIVFEGIEDLAESIRQVGILEPLIVHEEPNGRFRLVVGERRLRASKMLGLEKVPVRIMRGLGEFDIRRIQVAENNDRGALTPYEKSRGVIEDVNAYGTKEAMKIWKRSEAWINKRVAAGKYAPPVQDLLRSNFSDDFELLHSLNQICEVSPNDFQSICQKIANGKTISRDEARVKLAAIKAHQEARKKHQGTGKIGGRGAVVNATEGKAPRAGAAASGQRVAARLDGVREKIFELGRHHQSLFEAMNRHAADLDMNLEDADWMLWQGFLAFVLPALSGIGHGRYSLFLKKLQADLKGKDPRALWGEVIASKNGMGEALSGKPDGWAL